MKARLSSVFKRTRAHAPPEVKSKAGPLVALELAHRAHWSPKHYGALAKEGFQKNPIAYRCVRLLSAAAASVSFKTNQPDIGQLLAENSDALERFYGHLQVGGVAFLQMVLHGDVPKKLLAVRPDAVSVRQGIHGVPTRFDVSENGQTRHLPIDPLTGRSVMMSLSLFNPLDTQGGYSPLAAASQAVDIHNEGGRWTKSLLDNSARPSGALIFNGGDGRHNLSHDQFERLKSELEGAYSGARHAGRPMVLEGGLDWKAMSLTPADMDFLEARREAAREIALAMGVPPMLLGIPGDVTYANYKEANLAFWRQTIIPLVRKTGQELGIWLRPFTDDGLTIEPDLDTIPALSTERAALWARLEQASFLTDAEKRVLAGMEVRSEQSN